MALSPPFPLNVFTSSISTSPSLSFSLLQTRTPSPSSFRTLKLETCCSFQIIEVESEESQQPRVAYKITKKKRKPKPSFYDQIRDRWSLKIDSERSKFPWQEQEQDQDQQQQKERLNQREGSQQHSGTLSSAQGNAGNSSIDAPVSFSLGNRFISAPWIHGRNPRKPHLDSVTERSCKEGKEEGEFHGYSENSTISKTVEKGKDFEKVVNSNGDFKERSMDDFPSAVVKLDESSIGLAGENSTVLGGDFGGISLDENWPGEDVDFENFMGSSDNGNLIRLPWEMNRGLDSADRRRSNTELAEKMVPEPELRRLKNVALRMKERIKVGATGITQALVDCIHDKWKEDEVVKIKFEGPPALNMKRTHEVLENKTGGLVILRSGSSLVLYRGMAYKLRCIQLYAKQNQPNPNIARSKDSISDASETIGVNDSVRTMESYKTGPVTYSKDLSEEELRDISDLNNLLDELGPRYKDWSGRDPQPVDADLLPSVVHGYKPPFRLIPFGVRHCLGNREMTSFRRLARTMLPHFALGRNRQLQGLAMAMVKLWETSAIAKIAIKRGVQNTCNERMAEEIKKLTGGTLLSRNKDYIVFYRGNDFLPPAITEALVERRKLTELRQDEEEKARQSASALIDSNAKAAKGPLVAGTLAETMAANSRWGNQPSSKDMEKMMRDAALARHASLVRYLEKKLAHAQKKVKKAEKALGKVQEFLKPTGLPTDLETITDEERYLFRKIGLSMKPFLLLGRRGIFDGTVENMHLHWKYRELVKIMVKGKSFAQVKHIAISLEAESGGLLISLDKTTKGYAIIVYRGKNYQSPHALRPKNLLTRRQALARSIELQRREALNHHIMELRERIEMLKSELDQMTVSKEMGGETLYSRWDNDYASDGDMEDEDEDEEAYLEVYDSSDEDSNTQN
ncbi:hypothetical protein HHK36_006001 [Tetracentron sinense]|uniref:CRM domain-containing protein n=1 Tax=Tetracentron sinense TaxID=13715 RepID=A0A834ZGF5_TETSI|nr:hypothetical protein HHK36_006001 [Tetracentron sinense]